MCPMAAGANFSCEKEREMISKNSFRLIRSICFTSLPSSQHIYSLVGYLLVLHKQTQINYSTHCAGFNCFGLAISSKLMFVLFIRVGTQPFACQLMLCHPWSLINTEIIVSTSYHNRRLYNVRACGLRLVMLCRVFIALLGCVYPHGR